MPNDIKRLREQQLFGQYGIPGGDIMGGMGDVGLGGFGNINFGAGGPQPNDPFENVGFGAPPPPPDVMGIPNLRAPMMAPPEAPRQPSLWDQANQVYTPETRASDRFNKLLDEPPELNSPGWARKLVASGLAIGSKDPVKTAEEVLQAPYLRKMQDWKTKAEPFSQAETHENTSNANERVLAGNLVTANVNLRKADETERSNRAKEENTRIRNEAYAFRQTHPNWEINFDGPDIIAVAPDGSRKVNLGPSGNMSDIDKENLKQKNAIAQIDERGAQQRQTNLERPVTSGGRGGTGTATSNKVERNDIFQRIYDQPEYREFVSPPLTANGSWQIADPPTQGFFESDKSFQPKLAKYNQVREAFGYSPYQPGGAVPTQTVPPQPQPQSNQAPPQVGPAATQGLGPQRPPSMAPSIVNRAGSYGSQGPQEPGKPLFPQLPPGAPTTKVEQMQRANGPRDMELPQEGGTPPLGTQDLPPGTIIQQSSVTGKYRISYDNGQNWMEYRPPSGAR